MSGPTEEPGRTKPSKIVLLVHRDLGFVMWLGQMLAARGYAVVPATNAQEALALIEELPIPKIDLLVANPASIETAGLISTLESRQGTLKMVAIEDPFADANALAGVPTDPSSLLSEWLVIVLQALGEKNAGGEG